MERSGRHGALAVRDAVGQPALQQGSAAPAHSEGPHLEAGPRRQRAQRTSTEDTDAGGEPEEWRRVQRDPQARRRDGDVAQVDIAPSMERIAPVT